MGKTEKHIIFRFRQQMIPEEFSGVIPAFGYFLIVPQDYTGSGAPNLRYSGASYSIAQKNNTVLLYGNYGTLLDKVGFGAAVDFENVPFACEAESQCLPKTKSIERK